ncbi:MAG: tape measure protein, partial [Treponema sp.]|nr:tape measure protein [Treponema sp.]
MQVTDELRVLVEAEVARAIENFKKLSEGIDDSEQKSQSLGDALESLSKKSMIISGVFAGAGIAAIKFAGENEKLKLSVKNMLGSASEATAVFEDWKRLGSSPGLSADEVFSLGKALVNMGNDTQYATSTIQMLGNVAAGTSVSFGEISGTFEHVRAAGSLTTRDLVRLQQQGIPVVKQLAKEMGISEEQVRRLAAEGKLGFTDLERAFKSMTGPGGQFAGMMDELSGTVMEKFSSAADDAKQALASFGELLLPLATELLTGASSVLRGISAMDDGTRRFVLGVGGVVAVSGPVISAIKGIQAAMTAAMANPYMLAIGGIIAAAGLVGGIINKQAHAYEDLNSQIHKTKHEADDLLRSYAGGNDAKILDKEITEKLIRLYPDLAGEIKAYSMTVEDATRILDENTKAEVVNASQKQIEKLKKQAEAAENAAAAYEKFSQDVVKNIEISEKLGDAAQVKRFKEAIETYKYGWDEAAGKAEKTQREINAQLAKIGKTLGEDFAIIDIPVVLSVDTDSLYTPPEAVIKKWQEWFGEIAKVDPTLIGNSGAKAAQLYTSEFERTITAQSTIAETLGAKLDIAGVLRSRQADVQNALAELFAIDPEKIDQPFSLADESVKRLIEEYKRLGAEAKRLEDSLTVTNTLDD